jgi:precorrin-8X/cobalt-precorrin-8 methylmutase
MFDTIVVVDWSANSTPKGGADSIWVAVLDIGTGVVVTTNPRTRSAARAQLLEVLQRPGRTLAGFDFPFGYPSGFATAAGLTGDVPWRATWRHLADAIDDDDRNHNNRWEVAAELNRRIGQRWFWGAPVRRAGEHLTSKKPGIDAPPAEFREVERRLRDDHLRRPFPCRQLLGVGSVGSQALTGIPVLEHLRTHTALAARLKVWPFEPIDPATPEQIVLAEVWPSMVELPSDDRVKDERQVVTLAEHLAELDRTGLLHHEFDHATTPHLDPHTAERVGREEGWVLLV